MIEDLILSIGTGGFARTLFGVLEHSFAIRQVVVHRYSRQGVEALAVEHGCARARNPHSQVQRYVSSLYRRDPNRDFLTPSVQPSTHLRNVDAASIKDREYRSLLFASVGIAGKLSLIKRQPDHVLAITLYRGEDVGPFSAGDCGRIEGVHGYLLAAVQRHYCSIAQPGVPLLAQIQATLAASKGGKRLSARERQVCAHVVLGYSNEAIGLNLGLSFHSVVTYRRRAYEKLGVSSQNELFGLLLGGCPAILATAVTAQGAVGAGAEPN